MPGVRPVGNVVEGVGSSRLIHWRLGIVVHIIAGNSRTAHIHKAAPCHSHVVGGLPAGRGIDLSAGRRDGVHYRDPDDVTGVIGGYIPHDQREVVGAHGEAIDVPNRRPVRPKADVHPY